jgi:hypothetical protein
MAAAPLVSGDRKRASRGSWGGEGSYDRRISEVFGKALGEEDPGRGCLKGEFFAYSSPSSPIGADAAE